MARLELLNSQSIPPREWKRLTVCLLAVALVFVNQRATAQDEEDPPLETRVYNVADLVVPVPSYDYQNTGVPSLGMGGLSRPGSSMGGMGGMGGGMGGMGGGMGGGAPAQGGGMFNVADDTLAQVAPGGGKGGATTATSKPQFNFDALIDAITTSVDSSTWDEVGGPGTIVPLGGTLIVTQTAAVHKKVDQLLKDIRAAGQNQRTVTIRATWVLLTSEQVASVQANLGSEGGGGAVDRDVFLRLAEKVIGYRGQITCFDNQTVHLVAGRGRSAITGAIPVVGSGAAYQPIVAFPQSGAVLQITPYVSADAQTAVLDIHSSVIQAAKPEPPVPFLATNDTVGDGKSSSLGTLNLDRVNLLAQQLMTTLRVPIGGPVLIGGLSQEPGAPQTNAAEDEQLYLFIETNTKDFGK